MVVGCCRTIKIGESYVYLLKDETWKQHTMQWSSRSCGGRVWAWRNTPGLEKYIRLCLDCAYKQGVLW